MDTLFLHRPLKTREQPDEGLEKAYEGRGGTVERSGIHTAFQ
jgi:hypothetical protein